MSERPGIAEVADRLISHMDRSRRLYMLLIASSLALAVASLAFMALALSPGAMTAAGPAYEYYGGMPGAYEGVFEGRLLGSADGPAGPFYGEFVGEFDGAPSALYGEFVGSFEGTFDDLYDGAPDGELGVFEGRFEGVFYGEFYGMDDPGAFARSLQGGDAPVPAGAPPPAGQPSGIAPALAAFVGVIAAMSLLVLYVGLRESMFYSDWAPRFKKYREQREAIDRELGSPEEGPDATPSS